LKSVAKAGLDGGAGDDNVDSTASPEGQPKSCLACSTCDNAITALRGVQMFVALFSNKA